MSDALTGDQQVQDGMLLDVVDGLFVRHHGEIVAIALQDFVVDTQPRPGSRTAVMDLGTVDTIVCITLGALHEVLVDATTNFEAALQHLSAMFVQAGLLLQCDRYAEALHSSAGLVGEGPCRHRSLSDTCHSQILILSNQLS